MTKLRIEAVSRVFPGVRGGAPTRALEPVTLDVRANDFITVLGPSGCGKSTLLRILAGLDRPSQRLLEHLSAHEPLVRRHVAGAEVAVRVASVRQLDVDRDHEGA